MVEVTIPNDATGQDFFKVEQWVTAVLPDVVQEELSNWNHVMYVFPENVDSKYAGFAYYNWYLSMYHNTHVSELLVQVRSIVP